MKLNPEQKRRVERFIYDEWVDEEDDEQKTMSNLKLLLNEVESPVEIDYMLKDFNWDCGIAGLDFILTHPMTDPATKFRAFWMAGPGYFCQYEKERDISEYELDEWTSQYIREEGKLPEKGRKSFYCIPSGLYDAI